MIACEYRTSCILPPMIIFTGVHWTKLMKQWSMLKMFQSKKISLIWDKHTSHYSTEVLDLIANCNEQTTSTKIVIKMVDEGLTPIIQVPDIAVNKDFKAGVKKRYHEYQSLPVTIGEKIAVSRDTLVDFVLNTIDEINNSNNENPFISDAFK